jgi:flagellar basal body rod protein FlgG
MNYGLYLSASGVLVNMHRQDVLANNLANVNTTAFKRQLVTFTERQPEVREDLSDPGTAQELLDRIGGGLFVQPSNIDLTPGALKVTDDPLNVAIKGEGFFAVSVDDEGGTHTRLTRDGRLAIDPQGRLVTQLNQYPILDINDQPITVDRDSRVTIDALGNVRQDGGAVGQIQLTAVPDASRLRHLGRNLLAVPAEDLDHRSAASGQLVQGALEQSNVDPIRTQVQMMEAMRAIQISSALIRHHDMVMDRAVNSLGRVA